MPYDATIMGDFSLPSAEAGSIKVPALVGGGLKSPASMHNAVKQTANAIPCAELKMFPGQTHNLSMKVLAPAVIEFFNK